MANLQYGLKEVANVIFFDVATGKPEIFFDTLKVSTIENQSESAEARGGQGNSKLMSWDYGRTATLTMQDALLSDSSLAMLAGTEVETENIKVVGRESLVVTENGSDLEITLKESTFSNLAVMAMTPAGILTGEEVTVDLEGSTGSIVKITAGAVAGDKVMAIYEYTVSSGATKVTFSGDKFPSTYKVVGDTIVRGRDGKDRKMQFMIPKAKLQSTFSLTMDVENVSTFDFNLDVLTESGTNKMYDIVRLG